MPDSPDDEQDGAPAYRLNVPPREPVRLTNNFIRTVVCELRFPALLKLDPDEVAAFQRELRSYYPLYEPVRSVAVNAGDPQIHQETVHVLRSKDRHWSVSLKGSAVALETDRYLTYEEMIGRLRKILAGARSLIDAPAFTRIGLRYINEIPIHGIDMSTRIARVLIEPLVDYTFGTVARYWHEVRGYGRVRGEYWLRHGWDVAGTERGHYRIDLDFFEEDVPYDGVEGLLSELRADSFSLYMWCLAPEFQAELIPAAAES